ncbi:hypothetical protein ABH905_005245 [Pseudomonas frederiksbergensis]|uniref:hypothetical protein n=1 Tax=Pseudomonas frederiksbergensis TaxID=104087 RepID=UPI003D2561D2
MPNIERLTLRRLLSLKQQREKRQRAALSALAHQQIELQDSIARVTEQRCQLWNHWRERSATSQVLDHIALQKLKIELAHFHHQDHLMADRLETLDTEQHRIHREQAEGQLQLHKLLVEQEKLNWLLE